MYCVRRSKLILVYIHPTDVFKSLNELINGRMLSRHISFISLHTLIGLQIILIGQNIIQHYSQLATDKYQMYVAVCTHAPQQCACPPACPHGTDTPCAHHARSWGRCWTTAWHCAVCTRHSLPTTPTTHVTPNRDHICTIGCFKKYFCFWSP